MSILSFFPDFSREKKPNFSRKNQYHKIFLTLKILVNSNLSRKNVVCKKLNKIGGDFHFFGASYFDSE